jgi:basic membrane protein A and related proteins
MLKKRLGFVALIAAFALVAAACGDDEGTTTTAPDGETTTTAGGGGVVVPDFCPEILGAAEAEADGTGVNVGLTYDLLGRGDQSFNDAAACGVDWARFYFGVSVSEITPTDAAARATDLQLQAENSSIVIGNGFSFEAAFPEVCENNPDVDFAITDSGMLDFSQDPPAPYCDNARGMVFAEHEGSFLVGVVAALKTETGKVGFIGGVSGIGLIEKFEAGFIAGVHAVDPDIEIVSQYISEFPDFAGFESPDRGREIALAMYDEGADIVYAAAGLSGSGMFAAARDVSTDDRLEGVGHRSRLRPVPHGRPGAAGVRAHLDDQAGRRGRVLRHLRPPDRQLHGRAHRVRPRGRRCRVLDEWRVHRRHRGPARGLQGPDRVRRDRRSDAAVASTDETGARPTACRSGTGLVSVPLRVRRPPGEAELVSIAIEVEEISKGFPGVVANDRISLQVAPARSTPSAARTGPASRRS